MLSTKLYALTLVLFLTCAALLLLTSSEAEPLSSSAAPQPFLSTPPVITQLISPEFDERVMTRQELGNIGWALLHTTAAYFPARATDEQLMDAHRYLYYFGEFFPCRECGQHFLEMLKETPPAFRTREEFMTYLCELHNKVNVRMEKNIFDCSISNLKDRWGGDADCACEDPSET